MLPVHILKLGEVVHRCRDHPGIVLHDSHSLPSYKQDTYLFTDFLIQNIMMRNMPAFCQGQEN